MPESSRKEAQELARAIAVALTSITNHTPTPATGKNLTVFHAFKIPPISVADYVNRLHTYMYCTPECHVLALVLLSRLLAANPHVELNTLNVHRLLITASLLAIKSRDDAYYSNAYYASVGGTSTTEMNKLELHFLEMIKK
eukprot:353058_1